MFDLSICGFFVIDTVRDFSPVDKRHVYDPWGKSGAGAPIKGLEGQIQTRTAGRVAQDIGVSIILCFYIYHTQFDRA